ncbi:unnamed protein product [Ilex paraguariensis]|uniref:Peptidase S9A N-terminal domain-containing protein n=1 Tax=Ilex paraguariensis TaxID=185542 RepID=A0ABC8R9L5_9AQUA
MHPLSMFKLATKFSNPILYFLMLPTLVTPQIKGLAMMRVKIQGIQLFSDHVVVYERENGLLRVVIYRLPAVGEPIESLQDGQAVDFVDPIYSVDPSESQFSSSILRFSYSSLKTPRSVYDYDMNIGTSVLKKIEMVRGYYHE